MPVISISIGHIPSETKKSLVSAITTTAASVAQMPEDHFIVLINELPDDAIGIGGKVVREIQSA